MTDPDHPERSYVRGLAFQTVAEAEAYIRDNGLDLVAMSVNAVVGVDRTWKAGVGFRVYTETVQD